MQADQGKPDVRPIFRLLAGIMAGAFILGACLCGFEMLGGDTHTDKWRWGGEILMPLLLGLHFARLAYTGYWWPRKS